MPSTGPTERIAASTLAVITGIIADVTAVIVLLTSSTARNWANQNPLLGYGIAIIAIAMLFAIANRFTIRLNSLRAELTKGRDAADDASAAADDLREELSRAESKVRDASRQLKETNEELRKERARINDLEARLYPTTRDKEAFSKIVEIFNWKSGLLPYLSESFSGKQWRENDVNSLYEFTSDWREHFFDDKEAQEAFIDLWERAYDLTIWMSSEGAPDRRPQPSTDNYLYTIADPEERAGGYSAFDKARKEGLKLVELLARSRRKFERIGRMRGL